MIDNTPTVPTLDGFDAFSPEYIEDPQVFLQRSHSECPVFYDEGLQMWVFTRYEDVSATFSDWQTFSSRAFRALPVPPELRDRVSEADERSAIAVLDANFINIDPPKHTRERKKAQKTFTRPRIAATEDRIRELSNELIDGFVERGACDLMQDFCYPLGLRVILDMIGLPPERLPDMRTWIDDFFALMTPANAADLDAPVDVTLPIGEIEMVYSRVGEATEFFKRFLDERRANPRDDLASAMVLATDDDGNPSMTYEQVLSHLIEITAAGSETTASLIGHMVRLFSLNPDALADVEADPSLWDNAIEEGLRRTSIGSHLMRITTQDVEVAGIQIPAGSKVCLIPAGANADADKFPDPLTFDVHRPNSKDHLAFGKGRHMCLGAPLARLEARTAVQELYRRMPGLIADLETPLEFTVTMTVRGLAHLPVTWNR